MQYQPSDEMRLNINLIEIYTDDEGFKTYELSRFKSFGKGAGSDNIWGTSDDDVAQKTLFKYDDQNSSIVHNDFSNNLSYNYFSYSSFSKNRIIGDFLSNSYFKIIQTHFNYYGKGYERIYIQKTDTGSRILFLDRNLESNSNLENLTWKYIDVVKNDDLIIYKHIQSNGEDNTFFTSDDITKFVIIENITNQTLTYFSSSGDDKAWLTADDVMRFKANNYENISQVFSFENSLHGYSTSAALSEEQHYIDIFQKNIVDNITIQVRNRYISGNDDETKRFVHQVVKAYDMLDHTPWKSSILSAETIYNVVNKEIQNYRIDKKFTLKTDDNYRETYVSPDITIDSSCEISEWDVDIFCLLAELPKQEDSYDYKQEFYRNSQGTWEFLRTVRPDLSWMYYQIPNQAIREKLILITDNHLTTQ